MGASASKPWHLLARLLGAALAVLLLAAAGTLWWVGQTTSFVRWALGRAEAVSAGALEFGAVRGTLAGGFKVASVRWRDDRGDIALSDVALAWRPDGLLRGELHVTRLEIGSASLQFPGAGGPLALPASLKLPIDVRLDAFGLGRLLVASAGAEPLELDHVGLAGSYASGAYRIDHLSARAPKWGEATLQGRIGERAPFALEASGRIGARFPGWDAVPPIRVLADGTLEDFVVAAQAIEPPGVAGLADAQAPRPVWIGLNTRVQPLAYPDTEWLAPIELTLEGVEPAQLGFADAPRARISGAATIRLDHEQMTGRLSLRNALPGAIDRQAIPLSAIETTFAWAGARLELSDLRATLPGGGAIAGAATIDPARRLSLFGRALPALKTRLTLRDVDLSQTLSGLPATRLNGAASADDAAVDLDLTDASRHGIAAVVQARIDDAGLRVDRAQLATPAGTVSTRGTVSLAAPWRIDLSGEFRELDPAGAMALRTVLAGAASPIDTDAPPDWAARLRGRLSGSWAAQGAAWPDPQLRARLVVDRGVLDGQPLRARFRGDVSRERVADAALELTLGDLQASAQGSLGQPGDRLGFVLRAATLARLDARLDGSLSASGELIGGFGDRAGAAAGGALGIVADIEGRRLRWADTARVGTLSGRIELPDLGAGRVMIRADASALQIAGRPLDRLRARADGEVAAHALQLELSGPQVSARASARGALAQAGSADWRWEGSVEELVADAPVPLRLERPARLLADGHGAVLGEAAFQIDGGSVRVATLGWRDARIDTRGEASGLPVARWAERFAGSQALSGAEGKLQDLRLSGQWGLAGSSPQSLSGRVAARLDPGDAAESRGEVDLSLDEGRLDGSIDLRIPTLAFANRLIGPEWAVAGQLRFAGSVGGTIALPRLKGELTGSNLALLQRALGWRLTDGTLGAHFDGDRLDLKVLRLESGGGSIVMAGQMLLDGMHGGFTVRADRLPVPIGPGQRVVVSGNTGIASSGTSFEWKGDIRADEGLIELRGGDAPSLPDDVVIVDRRAGRRGCGHRRRIHRERLSHRRRPEPRSGRQAAHTRQRHRRRPRRHVEPARHPAGGAACLRHRARPAGHLHRLRTATRDRARAGGVQRSARQPGARHRRDASQPGRRGRGRARRHGAVAPAAAGVHARRAGRAEAVVAGPGGRPGRRQHRRARRRTAGGRGDPVRQQRRRLVGRTGRRARPGRADRARRQRRRRVRSELRRQLPRAGQQRRRAGRHRSHPERRGDRQAPELARAPHLRAGAARRVEPAAHPVRHHQPAVDPGAGRHRQRGRHVVLLLVRLRTSE